MTSSQPDTDPTTAPQPIPGTDEVAFSTRTPRPSRLRVAAIGGAALALAVGVVATSLAASPAPSASGPTNGTSSGQFAPLTPGVGADEDFELDHGRFGGRGFRDITITSISGSNVTLGTDDGWTRTIAVSDTVELTKGGQAVELSALKVGDQVRFSQARNADGTYTVEAIAVVVPSVKGTVSEVSATGFKVTSRDGAVWTIAVNGSTQYQFGTASGTLADVTHGSNVLVQGTTTADNALTALTVRVGADRAVGTVTAKTADSITITKRGGATVTVHVDADTTYRVEGVTNATLNDVTVDQRIGVSGRQQAAGSINADAVVAGNGRGIFGGHGPRGGGFDIPELDPAAGDTQG